MNTSSIPATDAESSALVLHGLGKRFGEVVWPHPTHPFLADRAQLLADALPTWAVAAGHTAGWVWTGMGQPQPWSLLYREGPHPSPMARTHWKPRQRLVAENSLRIVRGLALLSPAETVADLLIAPGSDELAVSPLFVLMENASDEEVKGLGRNPPRTGILRERSRRRLAMLRQWRERYA